MSVYRDTCESCMARKHEDEAKAKTRLKPTVRPWTRLRWVVTSLGAVPIIVLAYGFVWDVTRDHETGTFVAGSICSGLLLISAIAVAAVTSPKSYIKDEKWSDRIPARDEARDR